MTIIRERPVPFFNVRAQFDQGVPVPVRHARVHLNTNGCAVAFTVPSVPGRPGFVGQFRDTTSGDHVVRRAAPVGGTTSPATQPGDRKSVGRAGAGRWGW